MKSLKWILLVLALLALTACVGAEQVAVETEVAAAQEQPPTETATALPATETSTPLDDTSEDEAGDSLSDASQTSEGQFVSECTLVSSMPQAPEEYADIFAVQESDWVIGPEDAAITMIEYGDFQ
jgi:hypothetical protein